MQSYICLILFLLTSLAATAKDPASWLLMKGFGDETVIFYKPSKMQKVKTSGALSDMSIDFTATTCNDSVAVKTTHFTTQPMQMDSITVTSDNSVRKYPLEKIYAEPDGKRWKTRLCFCISQQELADLVRGDTPAVFTFGEENPPAYSDNAKAWRERKEVIKLMLDILVINHE